VLLLKLLEREAERDRQTEREREMPFGGIIFSKKEKEVAT